MEEILLISCMATLIILATICSIVLGKLKMPPLIGFLVAGILITHFLDLEEDAVEVVEVFSNLGLIMLMFGIGMEIDMRKLRDQGAFAITVACVQLPLMLLGGAIAGMLMGYNLVQAITLGAVISGSSTAVVMAVLKAQGTLDDKHIEMLVLITIMEDIGQVIILSMITPLMGGSSLEGEELLRLIIRIAFFMSVCFLLGVRYVPRALNWISKRITDELTALLCIGLAFILAFLANLIGLSVAIGAFLMGVMIASTVKKEMVEHFIGPLRSLFMAMFFISVGMEVTVGSIVDNYKMIFIIFALFVCLKTATVFVGYWVGNEAPKNGFISAVSLCAMGEFAFIISKQAFDYGAVDAGFYSSVVGAALVSMFMLPIFTRTSGKFWDFAESRSPKGLRKFCLHVNTRRSEIYASLDAMSKKARTNFRRGMGLTYAAIVLIIAFEAVLYFIYDPLLWWCIDTYGFDTEFWDFVILSVIFWVLFLPMRKIIYQLRIIAYTYYLGKTNAHPRQPTENERMKAFQGMNPLVAAVLLDWLVVILMPIGSRNILTFVNFVIAVIICAAIRNRRIKSGKAKIAPLPDMNDESDAASNIQSES